MNHLSPKSTSTSSFPLKRIPTTQLRPGMYLVRIVDSWWKSPFFLHRRTIQSQEEIALLLQSGIQAVEIDLERGLDVGADEESTFIPVCDHTEEVSIGEDSIAEDSVPAAMGTDVEDLSRSDSENRQRVSRLRTDLERSMNDIFEGLKTGHALPMVSIHQMAESLIREVSQHPVILTEVMLLENMQKYDKTLYCHVLDVSVLSLLVGLHLDVPAPLLHELAVAGLLHDVGFLRLPANVVKNLSVDRTALPPALRQHVNIGVALIRQYAKGSSLVHRMVGEHHEYVNGSGYPRQLVDESISEGGKLLGLVDYFDELVSAWGNQHRLPPALALRRIFQEVREGRFPSRMGEALVRTLGVFPVGTVVRLSTGEIAVVASHQVQAGSKPVVMVVTGEDGTPLNLPQECDLKDGHPSGQAREIQQILQPTDVPLDWQALLCQWKPDASEVLCDGSSAP
ncbi:MAG: HD-GYP domain-containing protein [Nitrospirales bacterium]